MTPGLSPLCRFGSNPVAEQYLTVEDGCLSPPGFRQQSSVAEHFLAVEDGFTSSSKLLKTVSGVSNIYGTTYGLKYINIYIYIYIYIENPRIEQTRKLASLAIISAIDYAMNPDNGRNTSVQRPSFSPSQLTCASKFYLLRILARGAIVIYIIEGRSGGILNACV